MTRMQRFAEIKTIRFKLENSEIVGQEGILNYKFDRHEITQVWKALFKWDELSKEDRTFWDNKLNDLREKYLSNDRKVVLG